MPANLTQKYHKAEQDYRRACSPDDEFRCLQVMLRELPKHKGTDKLQADLKQRISKAKLDAEAAKSSKKGYGVRIPRQGAGRVILLGSPNSGKSQLLCSLTRATPEVATYPFTTRDPIPGMMPWDDIQIQLVICRCPCALEVREASLGDSGTHRLASKHDDNLVPLCGTSVLDLRAWE